MAGAIFCVVPHSSGVEGGQSLGRDDIGSSHSKTTGESFRKQGVVWQLAHANNGLLAVADPVLDITSTDSNMELKRKAEQKMLH